MKKVSLVSGLVCYLLILLSTGETFALDTVRILYSSVNPHALLVSIAEKRGLYAKYGLSSVLVYVPGGSTAIQALVSGDADCSAHRRARRHS